MDRIKDHLLLEEEFVLNQEALKPTLTEDKTVEERTRVDDLRGSPMSVGTLEEIIDDDHALVSSTSGPEYYVSIMSFVDKDQLEPGCAVLLHHKTNAIVGVLADDTDPMVNMMKVDKAPTESYADIGGKYSLPIVSTLFKEADGCVDSSQVSNNKFKRSKKQLNYLSLILNFTKRWESNLQKVSSLETL